MKQSEKIIGNIIASILIVIIIFSILYSLFVFVFRDGKGVGVYGNRGNDYIYDDY